MKWFCKIFGHRWFDFDYKKEVQCCKTCDEKQVWSYVINDWTSIV